MAFPADFRNEKLAGKTAKVSFKIVKVQAQNLPEVDGDSQVKTGGTLLSWQKPA